MNAKVKFDCTFEEMIIVSNTRSGMKKRMKKRMDDTVLIELAKANINLLVFKW